MRRGSRRLLSTSATQTQGKDFDVLINGGGIVGAVFASSLLRQAGKGSGLKVGIIDPRKPPSLKSCLDRATPDVRVYALAPRSIGILDSIGSWKHILPRSQAYDTMQVWDASGPGVVRFQSHPEPSLGSIVEDSTVQAAVYQSLQDDGFDGSVEFLFGHTVSRLEIPVDPASGALFNAHVDLAEAGGGVGGTVTRATCRLLVGADGAASAVRKLSGGASWGWNYGQEAVVATVKVGSTHTTAWQRYLPTGPLALLPLWGGYSSIVWSLPVGEARRVQGLSAEEFLAELNAALRGPSLADCGSSTEPPTGLFRRELASLAEAVVSAAVLSGASAGNQTLPPPPVTEVASARVTFPLQFQQARSYTSPRVALIGDAAHSLHPQAGQGLNLGIRDAHTLATAVATTVATGGDIGNAQMLQALYGRQQYARNLAMMGTVDGLNSLFSYNQGAGSRTVQMARGVGMLALNSLGPLKDRIAKFATGAR